MTAALILSGVSRRFGDRQAVADLNLALAPGEFYALLGANGAGKSTTLRMIAGLLQPDAGQILVGGHDLALDPIAARRQMAFLPDEPMLYGKLRAREYLAFVAGLWGIDARTAADRAAPLLRWLDLWEARETRCENLSRGMQQKLTLVGALVHAPSLLILDEPLTGLDVAAARKVKDFLAEQVRTGLTVLFTTHILDVAERLASRIGLIHAGRLLDDGTLAELRARHGGPASSLEDLFLAVTGMALPAADGRPSQP